MPSPNPVSFGVCTSCGSVSACPPIATEPPNAASSVQRSPGPASSRRSISGYAARSSHTTNRASSTHAPTATAISRAEPHPQRPPCPTASSTPAAPQPKSSPPATSTRRRSRTPDSGNVATTSGVSTTAYSRQNQKIARKPKACVSTPPTTGPTMTLSPMPVVIAPIATGTRRTGNTSRISPYAAGAITMAIPCTARPTSSTGKFGARAHTSEPTAKAPAAHTITRFLPCPSATLPSSGCATTPTRLTTVSVQPMDGVRNSAAMCCNAG